MFAELEESYDEQIGISDDLSDPSWFKLVNVGSNYHIVSKAYPDRFLHCVGTEYETTELVISKSTSA